MDVEFINPFINATVNVLKTMAKINPLPKKPYLKANSLSHGDITGIIGMAGNGVKGSFAVSFSESCIVKVVSNMLGEKIEVLSEDVNDAVGEITNIIMGSAKAELSEKGYSFGMAIPTVVSGKNHTIEHVTNNPVIAVPFETEAGQFFIEASITEVHDGA